MPNNREELVGFETPRAFGVELEGQLRHGNLLHYGSTKVIDSQRWDIGSDGSIYAPVGWWPSEIRSPILNSTTPLLKIYDMMTEQGWSSHRSAGLHIHVDFRDCEIKVMKRLVGMMTVVEPILYTITDESRYANGYCNRMNYSSTLVESVKKKMKKKCNRFEDIYYGAGRAGLNLSAYNEHGSIEFRYFQSQDDVHKVEKYIEIVTKLVEFCKNATLNQIKPIVQRMYDSNFDEACGILGDVLGLTFNLAGMRENGSYERYAKIRWVPTAEELEQKAQRKAEKAAKRAEAAAREAAV